MKTLKFIFYFLLSVLFTTILPYSSVFMPIFLLLSIATGIAISARCNVLFFPLPMLISACLIYYMTDIASLAIIIPSIILISVLATYFALRFGASLKTVILSGTAGYLILTAIAIFFLGKDFLNEIITLFQNVFMQSIDVISAGSDNSVIAELKTFYGIFFENLKIIAPSIILSFFFICSYFSIILARHFSKNHRIFSKIPEFSNLHALPIFLLLTAISFMAQSSKNMFISGLMSNLTIVLTTYYTICGISLLDFYTKLRIKSFAARLLLYIALFIVLTVLSTFITFLNPVLLAMFFGMFDSILNYRLRRHFRSGK